MRRISDRNAGAMERPEMPKRCGYCENSILLADEENVLCQTKGVVGVDYVCRRFRYDPLKRVPHLPPRISPLSAEDIF